MEAIEVPWSDTVHGPDGPWNAINIMLGTPSQWVDAYPGLGIPSMILGSDYCDDDILCSEQEGFTYDYSSSSTFNTSRISGATTMGDTHSGRPYLDGYGWMHGDTVSFRLPNSTTHEVETSPFMLIDNGTYELPNGTQYTMSVSLFSLDERMFLITHNSSEGEPLEKRQAVDDDDFAYAKDHLSSEDRLWNLIPAMQDLTTDGVISSTAFGLHLGSSSLEIPGSLILGGYDKARIVDQCDGESFVPYYDLLHEGPPTGLRTTLGSLAIESESSGSSSKRRRSSAGLSSDGHREQQTKRRDLEDMDLTVEIDPLLPYLYLPNATCAALADDLPVQWDDDLGLYLWDTSSDEYSDLMSSATWLDFTFARDSDLSIKVPFQLLNLTLEAPLISEPTPYFPCRGLPDDETQAVKLGRAFLQAAYLLVDQRASREAFYLCQAPGPGFSKAPYDERVSVIEDEFFMPTGLGEEWEDTWSRAWDALADGKSIDEVPAAGEGEGGRGSGGEEGRNSDEGTSSDSSGPSVGAIVGGTIGGVAGLLALTAAAFFLWWRRRQSPTTEPAATPVSSNDDVAVDDNTKSGPQNGPYSSPPTAEKAPFELAHENFERGVCQNGPSELEDPRVVSGGFYAPAPSAPSPPATAAAAAAAAAGTAERPISSFHAVTPPSLMNPDSQVSTTRQSRAGTVSPELPAGAAAGDRHSSSLSYAGPEAPFPSDWRGPHVSAISEDTEGFRSEHHHRQQLGAGQGMGSQGEGTGHN